MPVEIKELVIRAVVAPQKGDACSPAGAAETCGQEAVIEAAVKQVLRILKASKER